MDLQPSNINSLMQEFYANIECIVRRVLKQELYEKSHAAIREIDGDAEYLTAAEAAKFLGRKLSTLYKDVHLRNIPYHRSGARKLLFSKKDLEDFIQKSKSKDVRTIKEEVENYIQSKNKF